MRSVPWRSAALAVLLAACGSPSVVVDASGPLDAGWVRSPPMLPAAIEEPHAACPAGFGVVALDGATACEPWPDGRPTCARGERLAAGLGCVPLATDCGVDVPPEVAGGSLLVREGSTGGDGSVDRPFGTIAEALAVGGSSLALAPGRYDAPPRLEGVTFVGTCPDRTTLVLPGATTVVRAELRRLAVTGPGELRVSRTGQLALHAVEIFALGGGLRVDGALEVHGAAIHDLTTDAILADGARSLALEDVDVEHVRGVALRVDDGLAPHTDVQLMRVVVIDVRSPTVDAATALVNGGGVVVVDGLVIEDAGGHGLLVRADETSLAELVLRRLGGAALYLYDTTPDETPSTLRGLWVADAAGGLALAAGRVVAEDLVVERMGQLGLALVGCDATIERVLVDGAVGLGIDASASTATLRDVHVRNVVHTKPGDGGALLVEPGAELTVERGLFEHVEHSGAAVIGAAVLTASDLEIHDVSFVGPYDGMGVLAIDGGHAALTRVSIHDVNTIGLAVQDGSADARDLIIAGVRLGDGPDGIGIATSQTSETSAATLTLDRVSITDVERWGLIVTGPGASVEATSLLVEGVRAASCCGEALGGGAIVVHDGAHASITRFEARGSEWAGLIVTSRVSASFSFGTVHENGVGLVQSPDLPYNTGSTPGLQLLGVTLEGAQLVTEAVVERPMLDL